MPSDGPEPAFPAHNPPKMGSTRRAGAGLLLVERGKVLRRARPVTVRLPREVRGVRADTTTTTGGKVADETYSGEFYCVKCKAKREASGNVVVNDKGTRMAKAKCPECGTNLNRILGKAK